MSTQHKLIFSVLVTLIGVSATTACTEEAPRRPGSSTISPTDAADAAKKEQELQEMRDQKEKDDAALAAAKAKQNKQVSTETGVENSDGDGQDGAPDQTGGQPVDNGGPQIINGNTNTNTNTNNGGNTATNPVAVGGNSSPSNSSVPDSETVTLKSSQATILSSVTDGSKTCFVPSDKSIVAADVMRNGETVTFHLVTLSSCANLENQNVVGISAHIKN